MDIQSRSSNMSEYHYAWVALLGDTFYLLFQNICYLQHLDMHLI